MCVLRERCASWIATTHKTVYEKSMHFFLLQRIFFCAYVSTVCLVQNWSNRMQMVRNCRSYRKKVLFPLLLINGSYYIFEDWLRILIWTIFHCMPFHPISFYFIKKGCWCFLHWIKCDFLPLRCWALIDGCDLCWFIRKCDFSPTKIHINFIKNLYSIG